MSFDYTGAPESFTVPDFVTEITVTVQGAQGGDFTRTIGVIPGGPGGESAATYAVVAGGRGLSGDLERPDPPPLSSGPLGGGDGAVCHRVEAAVAPRAANGTSTRITRRNPTRMARIPAASFR